MNSVMSLIFESGVTADNRAYPASLHFAQIQQNWTSDIPNTSGEIQKSASIGGKIFNRLNNMKT